MTAYLDDDTHDDGPTQDEIDGECELHERLNAMTPAQVAAELQKALGHLPGFLPVLNPRAYRTPRNH